jgi:hypothetical protein
MRGEVFLRIAKIPARCKDFCEKSVQMSMPTGNLPISFLPGMEYSIKYHNREVAGENRFVPAEGNFFLWARGERPQNFY